LAASAAILGATFVVATLYAAFGPSPGPPRIDAAIPAPVVAIAPTRPNAAAPPPINAAAVAATGADLALLEAGQTGPLPMVAPDGRRAWQVYARPFDRTDRKPRIAILVTGLGLKADATEAAIQLPAAVSLSFSPYAVRLADWIGQARRAGHEALLDLPMEPAEYPRDDPGPYTLLTTLDAPANRERLEALLGRTTGYVGLVALKGTRFLGMQNELRPIFDTLDRRGLLFVDNGATPQSAATRLAASIGLPSTVADRILDALDAARPEIDRRLGELEEAAKKNGSAVGIGAPVPVTLDRITAWAAGLEERKIALAPVSAVVRRDEKREAKQ
jgi:polysaccharide deacetylase 2 family uncharacterized protein YibQ